MSRLPTKKMSAAFAGLRGSKSKVEMTESYLVDGKTKAEYKMELLVVYNSDDELGVRVRHGTDVCQNFLHRGNSSIVINSDDKNESGNWKLSGGLLFDNRISGGRANLKSKLWPTDGNIDLYHLGTWLLKPLRSDSGFLDGFKERTLESGDFCIEGENEFGSGKIVVDPQCWLPKRIEWRQKEKSLYRGRDESLISDIKFNGKDARGIWPSSGYVSAIEHSVDFDFEERDGICYIRSWKHTKNTICSNGRVVVNVVAGEVTEIEFDTNEDILTSFDLLPLPREDFPLTVENARQSPYVWDGKWAVGPRF